MLHVAANSHITTGIVFLAQFPVQSPSYEMGARYLPKYASNFAFRP